MLNSLNINNPTQTRKINVKSLLLAGLPMFSLLVLIIGIGVFLYFKNPRFKDWFDNNPLAEAQADREAKVLGAEVSKLVALPTDESPTILTVTDVSKLKDQDFYKNAKNGDKVLIFLKIKKAILYDPDIKKIKEIAPLNLSQEGSTVQPLQTNVAIRNGTDAAGLAQKAETEIQKAFSGITIVSKDQAKKSYDATLVIVINQQAKRVGESLAKYYDVSLGTFPPDEVVPSGADILVILGKDRVVSSTNR